MCGEDRLFEDRLDNLGILVEEVGETLVDLALDDAAHLAVTELGLDLPFELRVHHLHRDDGGKALANVVPREALIHLFRVFALLEVLIERSRQGAAKAAQVRAALARVDIIDERHHDLVESVVVLDRDLHLHIVASRLEIDRLLLNRCLVAVEKLHELAYSALEFKIVALYLR